MNKFFATIFAMSVLSATPVLADSISNNSNSASQAGAQAGVNIANPAIPRGVANAIAPGLIASGLSCAGSVSAAAGWSGFGLAFGTTKMDRDCNFRENAKIVGLTGDVPASKEVMCNVPEVRAAYAAVGRPCIADRATRSVRNGKTAKVYRTASANRDVKKTPYP